MLDAAGRPARTATSRCSHHLQTCGHRFDHGLRRRVTDAAGAVPRLPVRLRAGVTLHLALITASARRPRHRGRTRADQHSLSPSRPEPAACGRRPMLPDRPEVHHRGAIASNQQRYPSFAVGTRPLQWRRGARYRFRSTTVAAERQRAAGVNRHRYGVPSRPACSSQLSWLDVVAAGSSCAAQAR